MGLLKYETQSPVPTATPLSDVYGEIGLCFPLCYSISELTTTQMKQKVEKEVEFS